ncbi:CD225/dispanin family protein [Aquimarina hainanensis]|uniref:CD225/dispanin family protein n=1 Tax=Aquimarina hainanensis TaxID=1578017 RepID=A0ABW5NFX7_9FLAO|nr:CD225/dispanin family protein [Aquimarina sp. TRL1]QKX07208.1 CD225/dispanin family protein [Aquimarina sp. TRL1]
MESNPTRPKNYLVESILATLFCCLPLGIVAIIKASNVNSAYDSGNFAEAEKASAEAKKWMRYAVIGGAVFIVLYILFIVLVGGMAALGGGSY